MSEDYQESLSNLANELSEQSGNEPVKEEETVETPVAETEEKTEPVQESQVDIKQQRSNEAFAAMRTENSKYKQFVQQLMKGANFQGSEEDFVKQMTEISYNNEAKHAQVSPEVLKRMDAIEAQNKNLIEERNKTMFVQNLRNLQDTFKLSENDIKEFINKAVEEQIDLTIPNTNFVTLYQGLFFDKLKDRMVEEARQQWIAQSSKSSNAANPDVKSGKKDTDPTDINTMAEFESLLKSVPK